MQRRKTVTMTSLVGHFVRSCAQSNGQLTKLVGHCPMTGWRYNPCMPTQVITMAALGHHHARPWSSPCPPLVITMPTPGHHHAHPGHHHAHPGHHHAHPGHHHAHPGHHHAHPGHHRSHPGHQPTQVITIPTQVITMPTQVITMPTLGHHHMCPLGLSLIMEANSFPFRTMLEILAQPR